MKKNDESMEKQRLTDLDMEKISGGNNVDEMIEKINKVFGIKGKVHNSVANAQEEVE